MSLKFSVCFTLTAQLHLGRPHCKRSLATVASSYYTEHPWPEDLCFMLTFGFSFMSVLLLHLKGDKPLRVRVLRPRKLFSAIPMRYKTLWSSSSFSLRPWSFPSSMAVHTGRKQWVEAKLLDFITSDVNSLRSQITPRYHTIVEMFILSFSMFLNVHRA